MLILFFVVFFMIPFIGFLIGDLFLLVSFLFVLKFSGLFMDYFMFNDYMGLDSLSCFLIVLSFLICYLMISSSFYVKFLNISSWFFVVFIYVLLVFLLMSFLMVNTIGFYFFFEASLIPIFVLILGWGYQPERLQAAFYMLFYTVFASLPLLVSLFYISDGFDHLYYVMVSGPGKSGFGLFEFLLSFFLLFAFMVKLPMYVVHLWLPKAHVEAPVSGSMILAAVLLKLGGYGIYRFIGFSSGFNFYLFFLMSLALVGGFLLSMVCSVQTDMKALVAYSSVVHMGTMFGGLISLGYLGSLGALLMMVGHGFCSSGLFLIVNLMFERSGSRMIMVNKGFMMVVPSFSMMVFLLSVFNVGAPPSINIFSEVFLSSSILMWGIVSFIFLMMIALFSMIYSLYLYSFTQHGENYDYFGFWLVSVRDFITIAMHVIPVVFMVFFVFAYEVF